MSGPLDGVRVVDFTSMMAGPFATMLLAEQGADVIKIESLDGDLLRSIGTSRRGTSAIFINSNRCKRSLAVNLKDPRGGDIVRKLVTRADVVIQNFRPGVAARLGFGYEQIVRVNPTVVFASVSGYGTAGPFASRRGYDPLIQAYAGISAVQGHGRSTGPEAVRTLLADKITPVLLTNAIVAALFERERSGQGQQVDTSMLHALVWWLWPEMIDVDTFVDQDGVELGPNNADTRTVYETRDGYIAVTALSDGEWRAFTTAADRDDLEHDARFATSSARVANTQDMYRAIASVVAERTTAEWISRFEAADVAFAPVNYPNEIVRDPQIKAIGAVALVNDPVIGPLRLPAFYAAFSRTPARTGTAPRLGQHTREILGELEFDAAEVASLLDDGVVVISDRLAPTV